MSLLWLQKSTELIGLSLAGFDGASCHVKVAHMARNSGQPPANAQGITEALGPTAHKELSLTAQVVLEVDSVLDEHSDETMALANALAAALGKTLS